jgi:hypothetical protein
MDIDIDKLKKINLNWKNPQTSYGLNKNANWFKDLTGFLEKTVNAGKETAKTLAFTTPVLAGLVALGYNKITSPKALADNVDKELLKATLDKEIAVWERYIADERERLNRENKEKKYDRFI